MKNSMMEFSSYGSEQKFSEEFLVKYLSSLPKNLAFPLKLEHENINLALQKTKESVNYNVDSTRVNTSSIAVGNYVGKLTESSNAIGKNVRNSIKTNNYINNSTNTKNRVVSKVVVTSSVSKLPEKEKENISKNKLNINANNKTKRFLARLNWKP